MTSYLANIGLPVASLGSGELRRFAWWAGTWALALVGLSLAGQILVGQWSRAGSDAQFYWLAGRTLIQGGSPYSGTYGELGTFPYAPPLAVLAAAGSLASFDAFKLVLLALNVGSLRYVAGSWRVSGLVLLYPWAINELFAGNVNFPVAAAIVAAFSSSTAPLAIAGLAKLSPFAAVPQLIRSRRDLLPLMTALLVSGLLTLPFLHLWPEWLSMLSRSSSTPDGALPLPYVPRLALGGFLVAGAWYARREWLAALGAVVAIPVLWPSTLVLFLAPLRLLWHEGRSRGERAGEEQE